MTAAGSFTDPTVFVALIAAVGSIVSIVLASILSQRSQKEAGDKIDEIHILVNSQMQAALSRIALLEAKLGLASGEEIPGAQIVTAPTDTEGSYRATEPDSS